MRSEAKAVQITDDMVARAHAEYHRVLGDANRSDPMRAALQAALARSQHVTRQALKGLMMVRHLSLDRLETEIDVAIAKIKEDATRFRWTPDSTAWHRAFGEIAGLHRALELAQAQERS